MTPRHVLSVLTLAFHLLFCGTGSADEALLVGLKNTSSGVVVSLVPSNHSLSFPVSLLVSNCFVPSTCGPRSFRCGNPIVVAANVSGSSSFVQYIILAPVIGAVLIMDWRLSSMKMNLSGYVVKRVVGNECDPLSFIQSTTGSIYMVCVSVSKAFIYTINLNTTSISSTTIPGYLSQYEYFLSQALYLLSNFVYNGETQVYFLDGNSLYSFDLKYSQILDHEIAIDVCDSAYHATAVRGSSTEIIAECGSSNTSVVIETNAASFRSFDGYVYPCTRDASTWFYVYKYSDRFQVEGSEHNTLSVVNGAEFHSAICVAGDGYNVLVTLAYVIAEAAFRMTVIDENGHSSTLSSGAGCSSGCGLEVFARYILTTGGVDVLVFLAYNGSVSSDPVIDKQFDSDLIVLLIIPTNVHPLVPSPDGIASCTTTRQTVLSTNTLDPSPAPNATTGLIVIVLPVVLFIVVVLLVIVVVLMVIAVRIHIKKRSFSQTPNKVEQKVELYTLRSDSQDGDAAGSQQQQGLPIAGTSDSIIAENSQENGSGHQSCSEHNYTAAGSEACFSPSGACNSPTAQAEEGASSSGLTVNTIPEEASHGTCGKQYLVTGTEASVPFVSIHPQNLMDQSLSEDHQNTHLSACV